MRLRGALLTTLTVLTLAATLLPASASSAVLPGSAQNQSSSSTEQPPAAPALGNMAKYQGLTVADILFPGIPESDQKRLRELVAQQPGEPLDRERIRQSIQRLHATGRFADIRVEAERTVDGRVSLNVITSPNYFVGEVRVEGTPDRPTANQVANASKLQLGELYTQEKLDRSLKNIKQLMEENGYYHSTVSVEEQKHGETQQADILFRMTPGPAAQVGTVSVTGNPGYSEEQVREIAKMHPGDVVSVQRATKALDRLRKKYQKQNRLLAQVSIARRTYRPESNAVDYTFDVQPGPRVEIVAEGFKIKRSVLKQNVPVFEENALDDDLLNEGRRNLVNYLQGRGYFDARVDLKKESDPTGDQLRVVYVIDRGERHKLLKMEITGNQNFPEDLIRSRMQIQQAGRLLSHGRYSQALLNDDVRNVEYDPYRANGFQQVKITPKVDDDYQGRKNELVVTVQINEGPQTLVGTRQFSGNQSVPESEFRELNIEPGQGFSETKIGQDREIILNYYFNHGFPDATFEASAKPTPGEPDRMDVTYIIHEGEQVFVDRVLVSGLNFTRPMVIQRELKVEPGEPLSQVHMLKAQQSLYNLGLFNLVDTAVQNPDGSEREKNVLVEVQEAKRYTFNYGLGFEFQTGQPVGSSQPQGETGVSPRVSFGVTRLNFLGRNHTVTFKTNVGRLQQRALVSYQAPRWFNSPDWTLSVTTFYDNTLDVTTFTSERLEGSVAAEQVISRRANGETPLSTMDYRLTYRRVQATNLGISPDQIPLLSQPVRVSMPAFTYIRDKRDNPVETTFGNYTTIDGGVATSYLGSEADFSRVLIRNSTYQPFGKRAGKRYVFARSTQIGIETPYGNTIYLAPGQPPLPLHSPLIPVPLPERFLSGGGNSHRGFGLNQAGPRDPKTGFPLGGTALFLNNLELRFPPVTLPFFQDNISFAIFHDAGNVFTTGHDMFHNLLRWRQKDPKVCEQDVQNNKCDYNYISHAIGIGVRYKTPIGPVRFDFGYNLNPPSFPSCQATPSSLGQPQSTNCLADTPYFVPQRVRHFNVFFSIGQTF